uniref:Predicted protein n=1 Tax=Hordeum vulgare subsp. vulgare TaxID=112509 RepID=F2CQV4_HORVV|nr:predicted protein [Hordeum vulgare subsp. vulgare]
MVSACRSYLYIRGKLIIQVEVAATQSNILGSTVVFIDSPLPSALHPLRSVKCVPLYNSIAVEYCNGMQYMG